MEISRIQTIKNVGIKNYNKCIITNDEPNQIYLLDAFRNLSGMLKTLTNNKLVNQSNKHKRDWTSSVGVRP
jgi:hypothetical protein